MKPIVKYIMKFFMVLLAGLVFTSAGFAQRVSTPTFSPAAGSYSSFMPVSILCATTGATIRYTVDGTTPTSLYGTIYTGPITINATTTLQAIAYKSGLTDSYVTTGLYTITKVASPVFSPAEGVYSNAQMVTITTPTPGATIRYKTDGTNPSTTNGTVYTGPVSVTTGLTIKAIAYKTGLTNSAVVSSAYSFLCTAPAFSPVPGTYTGDQLLTLTSQTVGASIRYTTNGTNPTATAGTLYSSPITLSATTSIKAVAYMTGYAISTITSGTFTIQATAPEFSPAAGTYSSPQSVAITSATSGVTIRYTTDGTTPSQTNGTVYSTAVSIGVNTTLKAIAYKTGMLDSGVTSGVYAIKCTAPTYSPQPGTFSTFQSVILATATAGATIRYTLDGTTPTSSSGTVYSAAISVTSTTTIKAIAYKTGMSDSDVASGTFTIQLLTVGSPVFSPAAGTYSSSQSVTITSATSGATIRYTTDGTTPSQTNGTVYSTAVSISVNTTLKAIAYKTEMLDSGVTSGVYTIQCAAPTYSPQPGSFTTVQSITLATATAGATIRYTTDGTIPTSSSGTVYSAAISVNSTTTIKAIASKTGLTDSDVSSGTFTIQLFTTGAPAFSPAAGTYTSSQSVTITSATSGATIRYTTDGTTPSQTNGTVYSTAVSISTNTTLKAMAYKSGLLDSGVTSGDYTIKCLAPTFSPEEGTFNTVQSITLASATSGATIRYTTNGTSPTSSSGTIYSTAISVASTTTIKAIAYKTGLSDSDVSSGTFTIQLLSVGAPVFSPVAGTYSSSQSVAISSSTSGATIRYTTDGTTPSQTNGTVYSTAVSISVNTTLKAIAYKTGMLDSGVTSGVYAIQCAVPTYSPQPGTFTTFQSVILATATAGATIRYTTDGTTPSQTNGTVYSTAVSISVNTTLKAIAYKTEMLDSGVTTGEYAIKCLAPTTSPEPGTFTTVQSITLSTATVGATIRYTINGTNPTESVGTVYTAPVSVDETTTIKAIAYKSGLVNSEVTSGVFTISLLSVASPTFSPVAGTYSVTQSVTISSTTEGSTIRFTTDGSTPSQTAGSVYSTPVSITTGSTLKAIAYKSGMLNSEVSSAQYVLKCGGPIFTPAAGSYERPQQVTLTSVTPGVTIRYTTDGTVPDQSTGTVYSVPVPVNTSLTLKAIAYKSGFTSSDVAEGRYALGSEDRDGDGVIDAEDDYPDDPKRALNNFFPAKGNGSLAFEDLWPSTGDWDLNDVVVDFSFKSVTNSSNKLVETYATFVLRATGAALKNGFGFQLAGNEIPASGITATGMTMTQSYITLTNSGIEANQAIPTFIVFDNAFDLLKNPGSGSGINTTPGAPYVDPFTIVLHIVYTPDTYSADLLDIEHFNPFIMISMDRAREVHLPDYPPTSLAARSLFGTLDDNSVPSENRWYRTVNNLPFAFSIYESFDYPNEKASILETYKHFAEWAQSSGKLFPDWFKNLTDYRDETKIYKH